MTQKQLASLLDKSESAVRMWELERNEPDITALLMLSKIFACSVDFLIGNELSAQEGYLRSGIPYFKEYNTNTNQEQAVGTIYLAKRSVQGSHKYFGLLMPDSSITVVSPKGIGCDSTAGFLL